MNYLQNKITALLEYINQHTQKNDITLYDAFFTLFDNYGKGDKAKIIPLTVIEAGVYDATQEQADGYNPVQINMPIKPLTVKENGIWHSNLLGTIQLNIPVYFKNNIDSDTIDTYIENATPIQEGIYVINRAPENDEIAMIQTIKDPEVGTVFIVMVLNADGTISAFASHAEVIEGVNPGVWTNVQTKTPLTAPPYTIFKEGSVMSSTTLDEASIFFDIEPVAGYGPIIVDMNAEVFSSIEFSSAGYFITVLALDKDRITSITANTIIHNLTTPIKILYSGIMAEWEALPKEDNWNNTKILGIQCSDGYIELIPETSN